MWTALDLAEVPRLAGDRRLLDLRTGVLARGGALRSVRFVPTADPHALALRAEGDPGVLLGHGPLSAPDGAEGFELDEEDGVLAARVGRPGAGIAVAARDETFDDHELPRRRAAGRLGGHAWPRRHRRGRAALVGTPGPRASTAARRPPGRVGTAVGTTPKWSIEGAPEDQLAARFAVFHLLAAATDGGEAAVGARA